MSEEALGVFARAAEMAGEYGQNYVRQMLPSFIREGYEAGLGTTEMYNAARAAGIAPRAQRFYELAGNIREGIGSETRMEGISLDQVPTGQDISRWNVERSLGGYVYRADLHYVVRDEAGAIVERGVRPFSLRTRSLATWGEVIQDMADVIATSPDHGSGEETVLGIEPVAIYELVQ